MICTHLNWTHLIGICGAGPGDSPISAPCRNRGFENPDFASGTPSATLQQPAPDNCPVLPLPPSPRPPLLVARGGDRQAQQMAHALHPANRPLPSFATPIKKTRPSSLQSPPVGKALADYVPTVDYPAAHGWVFPKNDEQNLAAGRIAVKKIFAPPRFALKCSTASYQAYL